MNDETEESVSTGPEQFDMSMTEDPGAEPAVSESTDGPSSVDAPSGGTVVDGLLSSEPDISPSDAGELFDTSHPWHAHMEVFARKFLNGYGGIDGTPAMLHLLVAMVTLVETMNDEAADDTDESDDSEVFSDDNELSELPE